MSEPGERPDGVDHSPDSVRPSARRVAGPGIVGVVLLPGLAAWRRWPVYGALLLIAGVIAPVFALLALVQNRDDLVGLLSRPNVLRGLAVVALAAMASRLVAVWLCAARLRDQLARHRMRAWGSAAVALMMMPTALAVTRMEQARAVVKDVFSESPTAGVVNAGQDVDPLAAQFQTILLLGSDEGNDRIGLRTDTMILMLIHLATGHATLVSVPRNLTSLQSPPGSAMADRYPDGFDDLTNGLFLEVTNDPELNDAYDDDDVAPGVRALMEGLSYSFGITIDDYAMIDSCGFVHLVDAIGGVTIDIDKKLPMPSMMRCSNYRLTPTIGPGPTYMDGTKALGYVRSRKADSDYERMERQRILMETIAASIGLDDILLRFGDIADSVRDNVRTSMTVDEARAALATIQQGDVPFESVGLVPPLLEPGDPDYAAAKTLLQDIRRKTAAGEAITAPTT